MMRVLPATRLSLLGLPLLTLVLVLVAVPRAARADDPYGLGPAAATSTGAVATWGVGASTPADATSAARDAPVTRARDLLTRSRSLDDAAAADERAATELAARLPALRASAKAARERAERGGPEDRELLGARADDLEADVIISEAEVLFKRKVAADNRRIAKELRVRSVRLVREAPPFEEGAVVIDACDPPFRYTADGRKIYRVECLK